MISVRSRRWFGRWLLGLFLIAQLAGVVPLVTVHLEHAIASEQDAAADSDDTAATAHTVMHAHHHHAHHGSGPHDHGASDPNDQCCTLHHHLAGVLPGFAPQVEASVPRPLAKADRLDVHPTGRDCSQRAWPHFEASCLHTAGSKVAVREARLVTADRTP